MISMDEAARDILDRYFYDHDLSPVRVYIATGGKSGPKLALKPDIQLDGDVVFDVEDYTFIMSPHLVKQLGNIHIIPYDMGFEVIAEHPLLPHKA